MPDVLGMAAMQPLAGLLRDITGSPAALLFFAAATMVLTVVALGAFRWIERRRSTSPRPSPTRCRWCTTGII